MKPRSSKKVLAFVLALTVALTYCVPVSVFGDSYEPQVVQQGEGETAKLGMQYGQPIKPEGDDKLVMEKSIRQVGLDTFDITLKVQTTEEIEQVMTAPDAAVVLVLDNSGSMYDDECTVCGKDSDDSQHQSQTKLLCPDGSGRQYSFSLLWGCRNCEKSKDSHITKTIPAQHAFMNRMNSAKSAAKTFVDNFVADNKGASRKIAVVQFNSNAKTLLGWTEAKDAAGVTAIKSAIDGIQEDSKNGGTNMEGGLRLANNLLGQSNVAGLNNLFVVMLSDGVPTFHVKDNSTTSTTTITGTRGGGDEANKEDYEDIYNPKSGGNNTNSVPNQIKNKGDGNAKLYTINFGASGSVGGKNVNTWLSGFANQNVSADNVKELNGAFQTIIDNIIKQMQAWLITDPMGEFIVFDKEANKHLNYSENVDNAGTLIFDEANNELRWDLKSEIGSDRVWKSGDVTHYKLTYRIHLNTADRDFTEKTNHATNGDTTLSYVLATTKDGETIYGDLKTAKFVVPQVQGTVPSLDYSVEYYKWDKETKAYPAEPTDSWNSKEPAKLYTTVSMGAIDENYLTKYDEDDYTFSSGETSLQINPTGNVIRLYYNPIPAKVIVNHYVKTTTIEENGDRSSTDYVLQNTVTEDKWKGDIYDVVKLSNADYTFEKEKDDLSLNGIVLAAGTTERTLYYEKIIDKSVPATVKVNHVYELSTYKLEDGKYKPTVVTFTGSTDEFKEGLYKGNPFTLPLKDGTVTQPDGGSTTTYTIKSVSPEVQPADGLYKVKLHEGSNEYTITYEGSLDNRQAASIVVKHMYRTLTVGDDTPDFDEDETARDVIHDKDIVAAGESYTATEKPGDGFRVVSVTPSLTIRAEAGKENIIVIQYEKDARVKADIEIVHSYTMITKETILNDAGEPEVQITTEDMGTAIEKVEGTYYVGQPFKTATEQTSYKGETYTCVGGNKTIDSLEEGMNTITFNYEIIKDKDNREDADLTVTHIYQTLRSYINDLGEIVFGEIDEDKTEIVSDSDDKYAGKVGDAITVRQKDQTGYTRVDKNILDVRLNSKNDGLKLVYRADEIADKKGDFVSIGVKPIYVTYTKQINTNTGKIETVENIDSSTDVTFFDTKYAGQFFTASIENFGKEGFVFDEKATTDKNQYQKVKLENENKDIELYFSKQESTLKSAKVQEIHHFKFTTTLVKDGVVVEQVEEQTVNSAAMGDYYVGQEYVAHQMTSPIPGKDMAFKNADRDLTFKLSEKDSENTINLYYEGSIDLTIPATVVVNHYYKQIDLNGTTTTSASLGVPAKSFANMLFTATEDLNGTAEFDNPYKRISPESLAIVLKDGENVIDIYYERTIDSRTAATVEVVHQYYGYDTRIDSEKTNRIDEGSFTERFVTVEDGAWIGNTFNAATRLTQGEGESQRVYKLDPEDQNVTLLVSGEGENIIKLEYSRDYASPEPTPEPPTGGGGGGGGRPDRTPDPTPDPIIRDEDIPAGPVILPDEEVPAGPAPETGEEVIIVEENQVPAGAMPQTGGLGAGIFYGFGSLIAALGLGMKRRQK